METVVPIGDDRAMGISGAVRVVVIAVAVVCLAGSAAKRWQTFTPEVRHTDYSTERLTSAAGKVMADGGFTIQSAVDGLVTTEWRVFAGSVEASMGAPQDAPEGRWLISIDGGAVKVDLQCRYRNGSDCGSKRPGSWQKEAADVADLIVLTASEGGRSGADEEKPAKPAPTRAGYFCTTSPADSAIGACNSTREACAASQKRLVDAGHDVGPCAETEHAVCFTATKADGTEVSGCTPTVKGCMRQRENATTSTDYTSVGECADR